MSLSVSMSADTDASDQYGSLNIENTTIIRKLTSIQGKMEDLLDSCVDQFQHKIAKSLTEEYVDACQCLESRSQCSELKLFLELVDNLSYAEHVCRGPRVHT